MLLLLLGTDLIGFVVLDDPPPPMIVARACERCGMRQPLAQFTEPDLRVQADAQRLFKPLDSTKGSAGMDIGAYQLREYVCSRT